MSSALQKLRKELDHAKARYTKQAASGVVAGPNGPVGLDVIEQMYTALASQDAEIRRLKGERAPLAETGGSPSPTFSTEPAVLDLHTDAYVGHTASPAAAPIYTARGIVPRPAGE
jgi:hypothetical protein